METQVRVYAYRWVVLAAFMAVNLTIQVLWISYAPVTTAASSYYSVGDVGVGALAMTFMIVYLPLSIPASYLIDRRGLRIASGFGALLAGVAGVARGLAGDRYGLVLAATVGAAIAQPFLLNAWTTVSVRWFPRSQRATAVGLVTLANLVGAGIGMALTPVLAGSMTLAAIQLMYGAAALVAGLAFVLVVRDRPPSPPDAGAAQDRALVLDGLRHAVRVRPFLVFLALVFVGMGVFNGVSTWVAEILRPRGFSSTDAGTMGALLLLGGVLGAVVLAAMSDRSGRRIPFLALAFGAAAPALLLLAVARTTAVLLVAAFVLGFFLVSAMPIGMQYAAEITAPTPEGTSNGVVQLVGQASVVFVYLMALTPTSGGSFLPSLAALAVLLLAGGVVALRLPEPVPTGRSAQVAGVR
ncbi:MAG TPA: MFS transporter [Nocardioidaceae bacterium]|jgi:MFS family permease|nr:MFS transporter [Nocardioidaceae bacterium]